MPHPERRDTVPARLAGVYRAESTIYGVVLVTALIAVAWEKDDDLQVLAFELGTVVVFWLAHLYAGVVSHIGDHTLDARGIWIELVDSARHSIGMLVAMVVPSLFLLLEPLGVDTWLAYWLALASGVAILAIVGWLNAARRSRSIGVRMLAAALTALFGLAVIALSAFVH